MKKPRGLFIAICLLVPLLSCGDKKEANQKADAGVKILATVNGVPITEDDVKLGMQRPAGHAERANPEASKNVLQTLVRNELIYQKSIELGLDKSPEYRLKLHEVEAQFRAFQRQELSALYQKHVRSKAEVTDAEAQEYFEKNVRTIQTKYHVWQIMYRGQDTQITKDVADLKAGMPFEKVALRRFPNLPKEVQAPWDIGYLHWNQIPPPWQGAIDRLETGKVSDIITGPGDRFWVIKLVEKTVDPKITFAMEKDKIVEVLRKKKADELYEKMLNEMKTNAKIVFPK